LEFGNIAIIEHRCVALWCFIFLFNLLKYKAAKLSLQLYIS